MSSAYFNEVNAARLVAEYPLGKAFLDGPARLNADALRTLQEHRFAGILRRGWEIPFYRRLWGSAGIEPGDIIAAAGGKPVLSMADFYRKLWAQGDPGDMVTVTVVKGNKVQEMAIRSGDRYQWLRIKPTE